MTKKALDLYNYRKRIFPMPLAFGAALLRFVKQEIPVRVKEMRVLSNSDDYNNNLNFE